jgi:hypothetical protein
MNDNGKLRGATRAAQNVRDDAGYPELGTSWGTEGPSLTFIADTPSVVRPTIEQLRASQNEGASDGGLKQNSTGKLNEAQGHEVEFQDTGAFQ